MALIKIAHAHARALAVVLPAVVGGLVLASSASADGGPRYSIRVANSGAGGDPGYFYVGGPLNVTVTDRLGKHAALRLCMTPAPIDRPACHDGSVGRTIDSLAPSKAGLTKLRVKIARTVLVRVIRVRKMASASAASGSLVGKRLKVKVKQLLIYAKAGQGSYIGSLLKGQSFKVRRVSRSGHWVYGVAYGTFTRLGWVKTSGLTDSTRSTRIGLAHESFDGSLGREQLAGRVLVTTPDAWDHISHDGAPTARFHVPAAGGCAPVVHVSVRAVVTRESAKDRARRVTSGGVAVLVDGARPGGWLRVQQLRGGPHAQGAQLYGIAIVRVGRHRWADVRAFGWFPGCSRDQVRFGPTTAGVRDMLQTARVQARIIGI